MTLLDGLCCSSNVREHLLELPASPGRDLLADVAYELLRRVY